MRSIKLILNSIFMLHAGAPTLRAILKVCDTLMQILRLAGIYSLWTRHKNLQNKLKHSAKRTHSKRYFWLPLARLSCAKF